MYRAILLFLFLCFAATLKSQFYIAGTVATEYKESSFSFGYQYKRDFIMIDNSMLFNLNDYRYNLKMGFRFFKVGNISPYVYIPYLNYSFTHRGYNTPLSIDIFYKEKISLGLDVYKDRFIGLLKMRLFLQ